MRRVNASHVVNKRDFLKLLSQSDNKRRTKNLINIADRNEIKSIIELLLNVLHGNVPIDDYTLGLMRKCKTSLRKLTLNKSMSMSNQKRLLNKPQIGGFLPLIAGLVPALIEPLITTIVKAAKHKKR